ncbi:unnamed protein product [Owenia fusiformis]|uniref:Uncharacterized protein n=1 Tax=Owenia fusiformis TaxID=6347 RepID=A0A8J1TUS2_OWEFU|nr:unnamed protein product [Owenia fusiformis]
MFRLGGKLKLISKIQDFVPVRWKSQFEIKMTNVSSHLILRKVPDSLAKQSQCSRPLVLLFPWLNSKPKAVDRYCGLYHKNGLDVLTIRSDAKHFLWPSKGVEIAQELLEYLSKEKPTVPLMVHAFSVGAYTYTICFMELVNNAKKYGNVKTRICGQILDSFTYGGQKEQGLSNMGNGIAIAATKKSFLQSMIRGGIASYFTITRPFTVKFYADALEQVWEMPIKVPTLVIYSKDDPMCCPEETEKLIANWTERNEFDVTTKCWDKSVHAGHLLSHPKEYVDTLSQFSKKIGIYSLQAKL